MTAAHPAIGKAWSLWQGTIDEMRETIEATPRFREQPRHRAQAIYSLIEAQAMAYNMVIAPRLNHPRIWTATSWNTYLFTLGQEAPDSLYGFLLLDGRRTYTVRGRMGQIRILLMQVYSQMLGQTDSKLLGNHDFASFADANGDFEVTLSAERGDARHWIPLSPGTDPNFILLRRFHGDWYDDMGSLEITMDGEIEGYDEADEAALARRIEIAAGYVRYLVRNWTIGLHDFYIERAGARNRFAYIGGETITDLAGSPSTHYGLAVAEIAADEAVIIEQAVPDCAYWSFQLGDVWSKSLDFMHRQTDINMQRAVIDADGRFRAVISQRDPGVPNWMDPMGRPEVTIVSRNYRERGRIDGPMLKTVKFAALRDHLPPDTPSITPERRAQQLEYRRRGYLRLYDGADAARSRP